MNTKVLRVTAGALLLALAVGTPLAADVRRVDAGQGGPSGGGAADG